MLKASSRHCSAPNSHISSVSRNNRPSNHQDVRYTVVVGAAFLERGVCPNIRGCLHTTAACTAARLSQVHLFCLAINDCVFHIGCLLSVYLRALEYPFSLDGTQFFSRWIQPSYKMLYRHQLHKRIMSEDLSDSNCNIGPRPFNHHLQDVKSKPRRPGITRGRPTQHLY